MPRKPTYHPRRSPSALWVWLAASVLFLWPSAEATACPGCAYGRLLQSDWCFKEFAILVGAPLLMTFTRLDPVRVLYTVIPLAVVSVKLQLQLFTQDGPVKLITALLVATSLAAPVLICCMGKLSFYRKDGAKGFLIWQPLAYCAILLIAAPYLRIP